MVSLVTPSPPDRKREFQRHSGQTTEATIRTISNHSAAAGRIPRRAAPSTKMCAARHTTEAAGRFDGQTKRQHPSSQTSDIISQRHSL